LEGVYWACRARRPISVCASSIIIHHASVFVPQNSSFVFHSFSMTRRPLFRVLYDFQLFHRFKIHERFCGLSTGKKSQSRSCIFESASRMAELHRRHDGEPISHHSVQVTTTAPIPTNDIMVLPGIYYNLGRTIILLVDLKRMISLLESWHGGCHRQVAVCLLGLWNDDIEARAASASVC
jgi:hypothetical protein